MSDFRYILRYYIDPGFQEDARISELLRLCRRGRVGEVMFFYNPEELFQGYPSRAENDKWFALAGKVKAALSAEGIAMSVNPWTTTVHLSRGRRFGTGQKDFTHMVGETGVVSPITACPLDSHWQNYLCDFFARIAREIAPTAIWVEDDWRLHNHEPDMGFGGCYCQEHLDRFARETGEKADRETLLRQILAPGKPDPRRAVWLKICRDTLLEPAQKLERAVHQANPDVRLGLMCSNPDVHSTEGRDWDMLAKALSPHTPLLLRPNIPVYTENFALTIAFSVTRQTAAEFSRPTEIYPELENSPRCGAYSKSKAFSLFECRHAALTGAQGITINHYDMCGNGLSLDPGFPAALAGEKPRLDALAALKLRTWRADGVNVLFSPGIAAAMETEAGARSMSACLNLSVAWGNVFSILGIATDISTKIRRGAVNAVSGQTLRAFSDRECEELLRGPLILDAVSAEILLERGYGARIGLRSGVRRSLSVDGYAYEEITNGKKADYGLDSPRMCAQRCATEVLAMNCAPETEVLTAIRRFDRSLLYPGMILHRDPSGGRVLTIAYPLEKSQFYMAYFNGFRRVLMQKAIEELLPGSGNLFACGEPFQVYRLSSKNEILAAFLNPTRDPVRAVRFSMPDLPDGVFAAAERLNKNGTWSPVRLKKQGIFRICPGTLAPLDMLVLKFPARQ